MVITDIFHVLPFRFFHHIGVMRLHHVMRDTGAIRADVCVIKYFCLYEDVLSAKQEYYTITMDIMQQLF